MANKQEVLKKLDELLENVLKEGASDLHLGVGINPTLRIDGNLVPLMAYGVSPAEELGIIVDTITNEKQKEELEKGGDVDFSMSSKGNSRFRISVYKQKGELAIAMRLIPLRIRTIKELGLPLALKEFTRLSQGLCLIVGPSGHGKSTTLAAIIDEINHTRSEHIVTIEDPIEYSFVKDRCIINQREVRVDTESFPRALRSMLREDADVVMVGEMRDLETIRTAITAAETGCLIFATLHTNDAAQSIHRIIDAFPAHQQNQIRTQLAGSLVGVVSQRLVPRINGGRIPATEVMFVNVAVKNIIRENKIHQLDLIIETSADEGMSTINKSLSELVRHGIISMDNAKFYSTNVNNLKLLVK
ncbi:PilT/PilU family type 4a pilus ATPase [bacterium]|nr:MAG: PilT/PilU family type 4a pilus ATPase [bacterium]